jgi:hypothetical protein
VKLVLAGGIASALVALVNASPFWVLALATVITITVLVGVMLPAVWSSDQSRRLDAQATLDLVLQSGIKLLRALIGKDSDQ